MAIETEVRLDELPAGPVTFRHLAAQAGLLLGVRLVLQLLGGLAAGFHRFGEPYLVLGGEQ